MSSYPTRAIESALTQKGFRLEQTHHRMLRLFVAGNRTSVRTRITHGAREYGDKLLSLMAKELSLSRKELDALIQCPLTGDGYARLLMQRGKVSVSPG